MYVEQIYTGCLSEASYYVESEGVSAIIDPMRDTDVYLQKAAERNATIKYIFETHFHADFVSGHLDLAAATDAAIVYGPNTQTRYAVTVAQDGQVFDLGKCTITVLHTPGHTMESSCFLLKDESGKNHSVFTGDTLFVGDVGRPDLAQQAASMTAEDLAGLLYDSIQQKLVPLEDDVIVYPAHGAGSSCGKNLGPETESTIGKEKAHNYALQAGDKSTFVKQVLDGLPAPPQYFPVNARINREGYDSLDAVLSTALLALSPDEFEALSKEEDVVILDTRPASVFTQGFIPESYFVGLEGRFAEWAGSLLPFDKRFLLVTPEGKEKETVIRLARVGFENFAGYLNGGIEAWTNAGKQIDMIIDVEPDELAMDLPHDPNLLVVDVRKETEYADGHVTNSYNLPLGNMQDPALLAQLEENANLYVHCAGGYRSVIAASLLKRQGIHNLRNVVGGFAAIKGTAGITTEKSAEVLN